MAKLDPVVKKETFYVSMWVLALSLVLEAAFLLVKKWNLFVLLGNMAGGGTSVVNYLLLGITVSKAISLGETKDRVALRIRSSRTLRMLGMAGICAFCIGVLKTNVYATLIPLLFPRIGLAFRPMIDRKKGKNPAAEGSDLLE